MRTYDQLKAATVAKGYLWFEGKWNLNTIWERTNDAITNHFTDWFYLAYQDGNEEKQVICLAATTKPGLYGSMDRPVQPVVDGMEGTAIKKPGQYISSHVYTINTGASAFEKAIQLNYFRQVRGMDYYRDNTRGTVIHKIQVQLNKIYGTHWHCMSNEADMRPIDQLQVNNWSEGCSGSPCSEWQKILSVTEESLKHWPNAFSETLLETTDFN